MTIYNGFSLIGGLAMFLFGMSLMGEGLERRAGRRLKTILENLTNNPLKGVLLGMGVTAVIQSSSATTVMLVGFVNSGIMQLNQAIRVIMGANIGTTVTAWILSLIGIESNNFWVSLLKPSTFSPLIAFAGIVMMFASKKKRNTATIFLGFAVLMFGMDMMSASVKGLASVPAFVNFLTLFSNPLFGVLAGAVITSILQSSSASVGILQALANTGVITYGTAVPIIMGQNIGTCITAIIASIGANKGAKRVAIVHLSFNVIGTLAFLTLYLGFVAMFRFAMVCMAASALSIAVIHSIFNILTTLMLFPFIRQLEKLANRLIPDDKESEVFEMLDDRLLGTPSIAIEQCRRLTGDMASLSRDALRLSLEQLEAYSESGSDGVLAAEEKADIFEDKIGSYLVKVSMRPLSQNDSREASKLLHTIGDFERISDHAVNLVESAQEIFDKKISFSAEGQSEVSVISAAVSEILALSVDAFIANDVSLALQVEPLEQVVDALCAEAKNRHIQRLQAGLCTIELGFIFSDILTNLERVADHCSNIAVNVIEMEEYGTLNVHQYVRGVKSGPGSEVFSNLFEAYSNKYNLT